MLGVAGSGQVLLVGQNEHWLPLQLRVPAHALCAGAGGTSAQSTPRPAREMAWEPLARWDREARTQSFTRFRHAPCVGGVHHVDNGHCLVKVLFPQAADADLGGPPRAMIEGGDPCQAHARARGTSEHAHGRPDPIRWLGSAQRRGGRLGAEVGTGEGGSGCVGGDRPRAAACSLFSPTVGPILSNAARAPLEPYMDFICSRSVCRTGQESTGGSCRPPHRLPCMVNAQNEDRNLLTGAVLLISARDEAKLGRGWSG